MPNKINGAGSRPVQVAPGSATSRASSGHAGKAEGKAAAPGADVHITGTALHLAALEQSIRELPPIDPARVAGVELRLEAGSYRVDPQRIADGLLHMNAVLGFVS